MAMHLPRSIRPNKYPKIKCQIWSKARLSPFLSFLLLRGKFKRRNVVTQGAPVFVEVFVIGNLIHKAKRGGYFGLRLCHGESCLFCSLLPSWIEGGMYGSNFGSKGRSSHLMKLIDRTPWLWLPAASSPVTRSASTSPPRWRTAFLRLFGLLWFWWRARPASGHGSVSTAHDGSSPNGSYAFKFPGIWQF